MLVQPFASIAFAKDSAPVISHREFLASGFAERVRHRDFSQALAIVDRLLTRYPGDPLLLRYRARMLEKLGRRAEAIAAYQQILSTRPNHVPTRLFLGLAYARAGQRDAAARELRWVAQHSATDEYRHWAQAQLARLRAKGRAPSKKVERKPYLLGKTRVAYDSNPLLAPDDERLRGKSKKDGVFYGVDLDLGYPLVLARDRRLDILYVGRTVLRDGGTDEVNFATQGAALDAKRRALMGRRAVVLGSRYDFLTNFLRSDLFSVIHRIVLSADTSFWKQTRTHLYGRGSYSNYGPDGSAPSTTSRDGLRGGLGVVQYLYTPDLRSYVFLKQEVSGAETRGDNYDRIGYLARLGVHAPLTRSGKVDADASIGFDHGAYPEFTSLSSLDTAERQDARTDVYAAMTYHWKPNVATRGFYRFIHAGNDNDFFDRQRHIAGVEMVFSS